MSVVDRILRLPELTAAPPVLVDVGAALGIHPKWRPIAKYSLCVAFEADERELGSVTSEAAGFPSLTIYNAIAAERASAAEPFHLTSSPFCSSRLRPRTDALRRYAFAPLFEVERTVELAALDVPSVLAELGLERVDWFKADSQGTDLRLFRSLGDLAPKVLVTEFEPLSDLRVRGSTRIDSGLAARILGKRARTYLDLCHKQAPGWAEVEYFNDFADEGAFGKRELLLGYAFAFIRGHNAFAFELASRGRERFGAPFEDLEQAALRRVKAGFARFPLAAMGALGRRALRH